MRLRKEGIVLILLSLTAGCSKPQGAPDVAVPKPSGTTEGLFQDVTATSGINFKHSSGSEERFLFLQTIGGGCGFIDFNNDGLLDVVAVSGGNFPPDGKLPNVTLWRNTGNGKFVDVTKGSGLDVPMGYGQGLAVGDYDNDGKSDIYITAYGGCRLFRNATDNGAEAPKFVDVTKAAGVSDTDSGPRWASGAAWGDYDGDGKLDLYVCHYAIWSPETDKKCPRPDGSVGYCVPTVYDGDFGTLYHNEGGGRFKNVTKAAGLDKARGRGLACAWIDVDGDGKQDLYVANDLNPNLLFRNMGDGTFREMGMEMGVALGANGAAASGMGVAAGDYTGTGFESIAVPNLHGEGYSLFENLGKGQFAFSAQQTGLYAFTLPLSGWGVEFCDFDLDGNLDLITSNGSVHEVVTKDMTGLEYREPRGLFHNTGTGRFEDWTSKGGALTKPRAGRGLATGDFDNDGRIDVLAIGRDEPLELFRNVGANKHHWIGIRLEWNSVRGPLGGRQALREGVGAVVRIKAGGRTQIRVCRLSSSYASASDKRLLFGFGDASVIESAEVVWPDGTKKAISGLTMDTYNLVSLDDSAVPDPRVVKNAAR